MNLIKGFNLKRFFLLIQNSIYCGRSLILIFSAAMGVIVILLSQFAAKNDTYLELYAILYYLTLYTAGFVLTGNFFNELHHEARGAALLVLPASTFEKYTSTLAITTVIYAIGLMILFFLISLISEGFIRFILGPGYGLGLFNPFTRMILLNTLIYLILQSTFFLGGVYFKTHAVILTILSLAIYFFIFIMIFGLTGKILFNEFLFLPDFLYYNSVPNGHPHGLIFEYFAPIGLIIRWAAYIGFWYVLAPLCWLIGYYRLKEKEV